MIFLQETQIAGFRAYYEGIPRAHNPWPETTNRSSQCEWWQGWDEAAHGSEPRYRNAPAAPEKREEQAEKDRRLGEAMRVLCNSCAPEVMPLTLTPNRSYRYWAEDEWSRVFPDLDSIASAILAEKEGQA